MIVVGTILLLVNGEHSKIVVTNNSKGNICSNMCSSSHSNTCTLDIPFVVMITQMVMGSSAATVL